jgi:hypothetical protein
MRPYNNEERIDSKFKEIMAKVPTGKTKIED